MAATGPGHQHLDRAGDQHHQLATGDEVVAAGGAAGWGHDREDAARGEGQPVELDGHEPAALVVEDRDVVGHGAAPQAARACSTALTSAKVISGKHGTVRMRSRHPAATGVAAVSPRPGISPTSQG